MDMANKNTKAIKSGKLAVSADLVGSNDEAMTAGRRAGELAASAGMTLDALWDNLRGEPGVGNGIEHASTAWGAMVDGFHDVVDLMRRVTVADWLAGLGCPIDAVEDVRSGKRPIPPGVG
jgi:hypothetical protein